MLTQLSHGINKIIQCMLNASTEMQTGFESTEWKKIPDANLCSPLIFHITQQRVKCCLLKRLVMMSFQILPNTAYFYLKEHKILIIINEILQGTFINSVQLIVQKITAAVYCISSALKRMVSCIRYTSAEFNGKHWHWSVLANHE